MIKFGTGGWRAVIGDEIPDFDFPASNIRVPRENVTGL